MSKYVKISCVTLLGCLVILLIWFFYRNDNRYIDHHFHLGADNYYLYLSEDKTIEQIISQHLPNTGVIDEKQYENLELPCDIQYYERDENGHLIKSLCLQKGTKISAKSILEIQYGSSVYSIPTDIKGLRYGKPFSWGNSDTEKSYYYVYLKDLDAVINDFLDNNREIKEIENSLGLKTEEAVYRITRRLDHYLYQNGLYKSPDLIGKYEKRWNK